MKFIAWGLKLHSHTHSYIHVAFCKAFASLGYDVYHLDEQDDISNLDLSNSIFLTMGVCDKNIPIIKNAKYILHNCDEVKNNIDKYNNVKYLKIQVYTKDIAENTDRFNEEQMEKLDTTIHYSHKYNILYQPWATDLLPHEIDTTYYHKNNKTSVWVGTKSDKNHNANDIFENHTEIDPFIESCDKHGYQFYIGGPGSCSFENNRKIVSDAEIAPAINGKWQKEKHYIPCRIFKNISYGKIGMTNNETVSTMLENNVIYGESCNLLEQYLALDQYKLSSMYQESANIIKNKHTYINRINTILKFL